MEKKIKLSKWAKNNGITYQTAYKLYKHGKLPCNAIQLETGTILCDVDSNAPNITLPKVNLLKKHLFEIELIKIEKTTKVKDMDMWFENVVNVNIESSNIINRVIVDIHVPNDDGYLDTVNSSIDKNFDIKLSHFNNIGDVIIVQNFDNMKLLKYDMSLNRLSTEPLIITLTFENNR
jgi:hypothetical protein